MAINELVGKTIKEIASNEENIKFITDDGKAYCMYHSQDCCERVYVADICGDLKDLIGSPIVQAEESTSCNVTPEGFPQPEYTDDSFTWTFYRLATNKGLVVIRWYGCSNGYYSESVNFELVR